MRALVPAFALLLAACRFGATESPAPDEADPVELRPAATGEGSRRAGGRVVTPERLRVRVVRRYPHQTDAFTQGLLFHGDRLYESTGMNGQSSLREVRLEDGAVLRRRDLPTRYFAEGLATVGERLVQITWQDGVAFEYARDTFLPRREWRYEGEGWGLCYDGRRLVMSDGSDRLTFRDPETFRPIGSVAVRRAGRPVRQLNELECVGEVVYANVWQTDEIVRIDPQSGAVTAVIDASGLLNPEERRRANVLNGIAAREGSDHLFVTGKYWPALFEVALEPG